MTYSIFLGPDNRFIPDDKWDEYRANGQLFSYDLVFRQHSVSRWYLPRLVGKDNEFVLGQIFRDARRGRSWGCIGNPSYLDKTIVDGHQVAVNLTSMKGFATRLDAAEYLMRVQRFTNPLDW